MGALEAVLQYRAQEQQKQQAQGEQIAQAFQIFQQARQQAQANQLAQLQMKANLAEKGLVIDSTSPSGFKRDTSLQDPSTQFLTLGKNAEAAKNLNLPDVYQAIQKQAASLAGTPIGDMIQFNSQSTSNTNDVMNQKDAFGEYTPQAKIAQEVFKKKETDLLELEKKDKEPLSGDTAPKFSGAKNGIENINQIIEKINNYKGDKKDLIYKANLQIEAENARDTLIPGLKGAYKTSKLARTNPESQALANNFSTLAENILRARTGAAAPDPEIVREYGRTLLKTFLENPKVWNQKLKNEYDFLKTTHDEIRPLRKDEEYAMLKGFIKGSEDVLVEAENVGKNNPTSFDSVEAAEKANLPKGTIITINGRKARID